MLNRKRDIIYAETNTALARRFPVEYAVWQGMRTRCKADRSKSAGWHDRGITLCERWREDFANFMNDMGPRLDARLSIERKNNNGPYDPSNCRWATAKEQSNNRRNTIMVTARGKTQSLVDWAEEIGISYGTLKHRYQRGWDHNRIVVQGSRVPC